MAKIKSVCIKTLNDGSDITYTVGGITGVTEINEIEKSGMYSNIPYIQVLKGENVIAELCQHNIESVHFYE